MNEYYWQDNVSKQIFYAKAHDIESAKNIIIDTFKEDYGIEYLNKILSQAVKAAKDLS